MSVIVFPQMVSRLFILTAEKKQNETKKKLISFRNKHFQFAEKFPNEFFLFIALIKKIILIFHFFSCSVNGVLLLFHVLFGG